MRVLCTGDIHIGRRSSGTFEPISEGSCGTAWERIARLAAGHDVDGHRIEPVDLVVISGDVTDKDNRFFQALGSFERGLVVLKDKKIPTIVVAGNHDPKTLPRIVAGLEKSYDIRILGKSGSWQVKEVAGVRFVGWSYHQEKFQGCPLDSLSISPSDKPTVGLAHVQIGASADPYAYATEMDFLRFGGIVQAWVIGHIHIPKVHNFNGVRVINPGSPQAMDANESGQHGVWTFEITNGRIGEPQFVPLSTAAYFPLELALDDVPDDDELRSFIAKSIRDKREEVSGINRSARLLSLRIHLTGRSPIARSKIESAISQLRNRSDFDFDTGTVRVEIDRILYDRVRPAIDLEMLSHGSTPVAMIARTVLELQREESSPLVESMMTEIRNYCEKALSEYRDIQAPPPDESTLRGYAIDQGLHMIERIMASQEATK